MSVPPLKMGEGEYKRRRRVWRYLNNLPGPHEAPMAGDEEWTGDYIETPYGALDIPEEDELG